MLIMCTFFGPHVSQPRKLHVFLFFSLCARLRLKDEDEPRVEEEDVVTSHF